MPRSQIVIISGRRGNYSNGEERAENGRMGRGQDAFSGKMTASRLEIEKRIEQIAARNGQLGNISINGPIHARHAWLKAVKF